MACPRPGCVAQPVSRLLFPSPPGSCALGHQDTAFCPVAHGFTCARCPPARPLSSGWRQGRWAHSLHVARPFTGQPGHACASSEPVSEPGTWATATCKVHNPAVPACGAEGRGRLSGHRAAHRQPCPALAAPAPSMEPVTDFLGAEKVRGRQRPFVPSMCDVPSLIRAAPDSH